MWSLGLVISLFVAQPQAQTIFRWVDVEGQSHFTNVPTTIPKGAQRHELTLEAPAAPVGRSDRPRPPLAVRPEARAPEGPDTCEVAREQVDSLQLELEQQQVRAEEVQQREHQACLSILNTHAEGAFAICMASRSAPRSPEGPLPAQLEEAREALRRAQVEGCR